MLVAVLTSVLPHWLPRLDPDDVEALVLPLFMRAPTEHILPALADAFRTVPDAVFDVCVRLLQHYVLGLSPLSPSRVPRILCVISESMVCGLTLNALSCTIEPLGAHASHRLATLTSLGSRLSNRMRALPKLMRPVWIDTSILLDSLHWYLGPLFSSREFQSELCSELPARCATVVHLWAKLCRQGYPIADVLLAALSTLLEHSSFWDTVIPAQPTAIDAALALCQALLFQLPDQLWDRVSIDLVMRLSHYQGIKFHFSFSLLLPVKMIFVGFIVCVWGGGVCVHDIAESLSAATRANILPLVFARALAPTSRAAVFVSSVSRSLFAGYVLHRKSLA